MPDPMEQYDKLLAEWGKLCKDYWRLQSKYEVRYAKAVIDSSPSWVGTTTEDQFILKQRATIAAAQADVTRLCCCVDRDMIRFKFELVGELIKKENEAPPKEDNA